MAIFRSNRRVVAVEGDLLPKEDSFHKAEVEFLKDVHTKREYKAFIEHLSESGSAEGSSPAQVGMSNNGAHVKSIDQPTAGSKPAPKPTSKPAPLLLKDVKTYGDYKTYLRSLSANKTKSNASSKPSSKSVPLQLNDVKTYGDYKAYLRSLSSNQSQSTAKTRETRKNVPGRVIRFLNPPVFLKRR